MIYSLSKVLPSLVGDNCLLGDKSSFLGLQSNLPSTNECKDQGMILLLKLFWIKRYSSEIPTQGSAQEHRAATTPSAHRGSNHAFHTQGSNCVFHTEGSNCALFCTGTRKQDETLVSSTHCTGLCLQGSTGRHLLALGWWDQSASTWPTPSVPRVLSNSYNIA